MNSKDRVLTTLEHEEPDRVPLTDHIYMPKSLEAILGEKDVRTNTPEKYIRVHRVLGLDLICAFPGRINEVSGRSEYSLTHKLFNKNEFADEWKIKHRVINGMSWYLEGPIKSAEDADEYEVPDPFLPWRVENIRKVCKLVRGDLAIAGIVSGVFTRSLLLFSFDNFVRTIYVAPNVVQRIIERVAWFYIEIGKMMIDEGVDIIWITDDLGMVDGPFLSPLTFRKYVFPSLGKMVKTFKLRGVKILLHSDGQIMPLMDDLVKIGFDGIHPIERKAGMKLDEMKAKYGDTITLIGNVDATEVLPHGTEEDVKRQVFECLRTAAPGGGYILASDHSIHEGVSPKNAMIMFKLAKKKGRYPIRIENY